MKNQAIKIFAGLLKCADCGKHTALFQTTQMVPYRYFNCNTYRMYGKNAGACTSHAIKYDVLYQYVFSRVQHWTYLARQDEQSLLQKLRNSRQQPGNELLS